MLRIEDEKIIYHYDAEELWIEGWGENGVRIRSTKNATMPAENWALQEKVSHHSVATMNENGAILHNGKIKIDITNGGKIRVFNQNGKMLLEEIGRASCRDRVLRLL